MVTMTKASAYGRMEPQSLFKRLSSVMFTFQRPCLTRILLRLSKLMSLAANIVASADMLLLQDVVRKQGEEKKSNGTEEPYIFEGK